MEGICPACGIAIEKWLRRQQPVADEAAEVEDRAEVISIRSGSLLVRLGEIFLFVPEKTDPPVFYGRCLLFCLFVLWGAYFIFNGISWQAIMGSFMHNINLPFHEFGHVIFSPFGRFMTILGGSLFQVLLPFLLCLAFGLKNRDNFAAAIMLWWCGQSFIDLSPYIADATYRGLPLIMGMGESAHDWGNLLRMTGLLRYDYLIARVSFVVGSGLIMLSMFWAAYLLLHQYRNLEKA